MNRDEHSPWFYLGIYAAISIAILISSTAREFYVAIVGWHAGRHLFAGMVVSVLHAPMSFFGSLPSFFAWLTCFLHRHHSNGKNFEQVTAHSPAFLLLASFSLCLILSLSLSLSLSVSLSLSLSLSLLGRFTKDVLTVDVDIPRTVRTYLGTMSKVRTHRHPTPLTTL
jgi:ABC-type multidrug transport system fused ATPase/permease subunit